MAPSTEIPDSYILSPDERQFYDTNGYLVIKGLVDLTTLYSCKERFIQICKGIVDKGGMTVVKEPSLAAKGAKGEDLINKIQEIQFDDVFSSYTEHPRVLSVISQIIGNDILVISSMLINKPPGSSAHPAHQDFLYLPFRPADKIIAAWTAIDDVDIANGCLYVIPRSHKRKTLYTHGNLEDAKKMYHGIVDPNVNAEPVVQLEMSPGDTVFFHPLLVHGSGANSSKRYRKALVAHFASEHCHYASSLDPRQKLIVKEMEDEAKRRGTPLSFQNIWRHKSKLVKRNVQSKL